MSLHLEWAQASNDQRLRKRYAEQIARRLMATRNVLNLSQAELCRATGIKQSTYNQYEKAVNVIQKRSAFRICDTFGLTLDWIYLGDPRWLPHHIVQKLPSKLLDWRGAR